MLTTGDLIKFSNFLREDMKTVFETKQEMSDGFKEINIKFSKLQTSVDGFLKVSKKNEEEILVMGHRINKLEQKVG